MLRTCVCLILLAGAALAADDLAPLSDEFESAATLPNWQRINQVEGWFNDVLITYDIDTTQAGRLVLEPYTSTWYQDYRGTLAFKEVTGDFVVTANVTVTDRDTGDANEIPESSFSLAGLMIRTPRGITDATAEWTPGGENYVFLSLGHGTTAGPSLSFEFEVKTTEDSVSTLELTNAATREATLQIARIGGDVIALRREAGGSWVVHRRYDRDDFPATMQVGAVAYTDWTNVQLISCNDPTHHNVRVYDDLGSTDPDIIAGYDYIRFCRPSVPPALIGQDLGPGGPVLDSELLGFLGDNANAPAAVASWEMY